MKNYIFFIIGLILFILHILYSPYPIESLRVFQKEIHLYFASRKIIKDSVISQRRGIKFYILSCGLRGLKNHYFLFQIGDYIRIIKKKRGLWAVIVPSRNYIDFEIQNFDTFKSEEEVNKLLNFLNNLPDSCLIFFAVEDEASRKWNENIERKFKQMGAKISLKGKYRWSYIFVVKKLGNNFIPLYEKALKNNPLLLLLK